jgi:hypothetical protein
VSTPLSDDGERDGSRSSHDNRSTEFRTAPRWNASSLWFVAARVLLFVVIPIVAATIIFRSLGPTDFAAEFDAKKKKMDIESARFATESAEQVRKANQGKVEAIDAQVASILAAEANKRSTAAKEFTLDGVALSTSLADFLHKYPMATLHE